MSAPRRIIGDDRRIDEDALAKAVLDLSKAYAEREGISLLGCDPSVRWYFFERALQLRETDALLKRRGRPKKWTFARLLYLHGEIRHLRDTHGMSQREACVHIASLPSWSRFLAADGHHQRSHFQSPSDPVETLRRQYEGDGSDMAHLGSDLRRAMPDWWRSWGLNLLKKLPGARTTKREASSSAGAGATPEK